MRTGWRVLAVPLIVAAICGLVVAGDIGPDVSAYDCQVVVIDWDGVERDLDWLEDKWGDVQVDCSGGSWDVVMLRENLSGSTTTIVGLFGEDGKPLVGVPVVNSWPDGSITEYTNEQGRVYFSWGPGAYYQPPGGGPYAICMAGACVTGLGWLWMTNHYHLDVLVWGDGPPVFHVYLPVVIRDAG